MSEPATIVDVAVIGAGQAGLATGFYLRRTGLRYVLLDAEPAAGGAWRHGWESLRLFSPAQWSSLPGWLMPRSGAPAGDGAASSATPGAAPPATTYPSRDEVIAYLTEYERRYELPVERPVQVGAVRHDARHPDRLRVATDVGTWAARAVVSATGSWARPLVPDVPDRERFQGAQLHSATYTSPAPFAGRRVIVVGGGNSGAQIVAELGEVAHVTWATLAPPTFLPDHVDGRYLFEQATARYRALKEGREPEPPRSLGDVVMVEPVRRARDAGHLTSTPMFDRMTATGVVWTDGREEQVDAVIWCTGFRPALEHLRPLGVLEPVGEPALGRSRVRVDSASGTRSILEPRLWLVGYGDWTGYASATLVGVGRAARATVEEIADVLRS